MFIGYRPQQPRKGKQEERIQKKQQQQTSLIGKLIQMLDVYTCSCGDEFAVKEAKEPTYCPMCGSQDIEFSHEYRTLEEEVI